MNKRTARTRQSVSVLGIVIVVVLAMACGDDGGPLAPTPQIPQVAGTYRGPITISSSTLGSVTGYAELEVVQAGSQVTITGLQTIAGNNGATRGPDGNHQRDRILHAERWGITHRREF